MFLVTMSGSSDRIELRFFFTHYGSFAILVLRALMKSRFVPTPTAARRPHPMSL